MTSPPLPPIKIMYAPEPPSKWALLGAFLVRCMVGVEFFVTLMSAWFGGVLLMPFDTFENTPAWSTVLALGFDDNVLGVTWLAVGLAGLGGLVGLHVWRKDTHKIRIAALTVGCVLWGFASATLFASNYTGTGPYTYGLIAILCAIQTFRLVRGYA
jgi:hypothetical protein